MRKLVAILVLCLLTVPVFAKPADSMRNFGARFRDRIIRIIRVVTTGDGLMPPWPAPPPQPPSPERKGKRYHRGPPHVPTHVRGHGRFPIIFWTGAVATRVPR
jgi:hypothetical protein